MRFCHRVLEQLRAVAFPVEHHGEPGGPGIFRQTPFLLRGLGHVGLQPGNHLLLERGDQARVHFLVHVQEGLAVHGVDPVIGRGAQTQPLARHIVAGQRRLLPVIDAHMAVAVEIQFGRILPGDPFLGQGGVPAQRPPQVLAQPLQLARAACALRGFGPDPGVCPTRPALHNAVVPETGCAPAPSTPAAERYCRGHKIRSAVGTSEGCSAAVPPPTAPAKPAARRRGLRRRRLETQWGPTPAPPWPPPLVPANAWWRFPSALDCRSGCARSCCLLR